MLGISQLFPEFVSVDEEYLRFLQNLGSETLKSVEILQNETNPEESPRFLLNFPSGLKISPESVKTQNIPLFIGIR